MPDFTIELLPDKPVILQTHYQATTREGDAEAEQQLRTILDSLDHPVFCVLDITRVKVEFSGMVQALSLVTRGKSSTSAGVFKHRNVRELVVICDSSLAEMGVKALAQLQYGVKATPVRTVDEALSDVARQTDVASQPVQKAG